VVFEPRVLFFSGGSNRPDCTRTATNCRAATDDPAGLPVA